MIQIVMVGMRTESEHTSQRTLALAHCVVFSPPKLIKHHRITAAREGQSKGKKTKKQKQT